MEHPRKTTSPTMDPEKAPAETPRTTLSWRTMDLEEVKAPAGSGWRRRTLLSSTSRSRLSSMTLGLKAAAAAEREDAPSTERRFRTSKARPDTVTSPT